MLPALTLYPLLPTTTASRGNAHSTRRACSGHDCALRSSAHLRCRAHCTLLSPQPSRPAAGPYPDTMARAMGSLGAPPLRMPWPQYLLFFRPEEEEEDLPGLKGFEPDEPEEPFGFLGAGLSGSEPDDPEACFSLFLALLKGSLALPLSFLEPCLSSSSSRTSFRLSFSLACFSASSQSWPSLSSESRLSSPEPSSESTKSLPSLSESLSSPPPEPEPDGANSLSASLSPSSSSELPCMLRNFQPPSS
mmetsp:Transcript_22631/g.53718  ORF Transcript_22631/g.53718 Transcript_22631/m.53718 type:complete len:248 (+) Transcript_22631:57-800(+)